MVFAAGLITGEALMGIAIAVPIVVSGQGDVLALPLGGFAETWASVSAWVGLFVLFLVGLLMYRIGKKGEPAAKA